MQEKSQMIVEDVKCHVRCEMQHIPKRERVCSIQLASTRRHLETFRRVGSRKALQLLL